MKVNCDYCKTVITKPIVERNIPFCEPVLWLHFCTHECSIRWESDTFVKKGKKKYLAEFLPEAMAKDKELGVKPYEVERTT